MLENKKCPCGDYDPIKITHWGRKIAEDLRMIAVAIHPSFEIDPGIVCKNCVCDDYFAYADQLFI
jgi:hypothetical protein